MKFFSVSKTERPAFYSLFFLTLLTTASFEAANVVATAKYIDESGVQGLPLLIIANVLVTVAVSMVYSLVADRYKRIKIIQAMLLFFAIIFLTIRLVISYDVSSTFESGTYSVLYIMVELLTILFPLAFWSYANDVYNVATAQRIFPILAAGALLGNLLGNWFAGFSTALFNSINLDNTDLLIFCSILCLVAFGIAMMTLTDDTSSSTRRKSEEEARFKLSDTWETGLDFVKDVPLFRFLALTIFFNWGILTIGYYYLLDQATITFTVASVLDLDALQTFLGNFKALLTMVTLPLQLFIAAKLTERLKLKNMFYFLPATLLVTTLLGFIQQGFLSAQGIRFGGKMMAEAIDEPSAQSVQGLVPDERRGRVGIFLDSYVYAAGSIVACLILLLALGLQQAEIFSAAFATSFYLGISVLMAGASLFCAHRISKIYDENLLNWRLKRKKRGKSVNLGDLYDRLG